MCESCAQHKKFDMHAAVRRGIKFADDSGEGVWRTINGSPVFIKEGQSVEEAVAAKFGKIEGANSHSKLRIDLKNDTRLLENIGDRKDYTEQLTAHGFIKLDNDEKINKDISDSYNGKIDKYETTKITTTTLLATNKKLKTNYFAIKTISWKGANDKFVASYIKSV